MVIDGENLITNLDVVSAQHRVRGEREHDNAMLAEDEVCTDTLSNVLRHLDGIRLVRHNDALVPHLDDVIHRGTWHLERAVGKLPPLVKGAVHDVPPQEQERSIQHIGENDCEREGDEQIEQRAQLGRQRIELLVMRQAPKQTTEARDGGISRRCLMREVDAIVGRLPP